MKHEPGRRSVFRSWRKPALLLAVALSSGCASVPLEDARHSFFANRVQEASRTLAEAPTPPHDKVLFYMERGLIRQAAGEYEASAKDLIAAYDELQRMTAISIGQDSASLLINDKVQDYVGMPYEWTLLHAFTAKDHLALANWENAAVEARRTLQSLEPGVKGDYPDNAYARYLAGFCLELIGDPSNAALQYRKASELAPLVAIDDRTGRLAAQPKARSTNEPPAAVEIDRSPWPGELVCFVLLGNIPGGDSFAEGDWRGGRAHYAEITCHGKSLGRSYNLADTVDLAFTSEQKAAARKLVKTATRIAVKEVLSSQIEQNNEALGALVRFLLIGLLEQPDTRRWETLPRWLQVARVKCPEDLGDFDAIIRSGGGAEMRRLHVSQPITRRGNTYVAFFRDQPPTAELTGTAAPAVTPVKSVRDLHR